MISDISEVLKIEVEADPVGLVNLIQNPSGDDGAWFWVTPINNTAMSTVGIPPHLVFTTTTSQACYFTSGFMPVTAGDYVAARFDTISATASHNVKVRYRWYDANQELLSESAQSSGYGGTAQTNFVAAVQVPVGAVYAKLKFDFYNGSGNPSAGASYALRQVMVTTAPTNSFSSTRTNLFKNPSLESTTLRWTAGGGGSVVRSTLAFRNGTHSLKFTAAAGNGFADATSDRMPVLGGRDYTLSVYTMADAHPRSFQLAVNWFTAAGTSLGGAGGEGATNNTSTWTRGSITATAPPSARYCSLTVTFVNTGTGELHFMDSTLCEIGSTLGAYFSGATASAGSKSYAWTGTADDSTSIESDTDFAFADAVGFINILGPTNNITINRAPLDPGAISLRILDTTLDPAVEDTLRTGRRIRITALNDDTAEFEDLAGRYWIINPTVAYDLTKPADKQASISLSATDNLQTLANWQRENSVGTLAELPYYLEPLGVPWDFNGNSNQASSVAVTAVQESASALDQVILTRDSTLANAWITKEGVLTAYDYDHHADDYYGTGTALFDESVYTNIDISFDATQIINEVMVVLVHTVSGVLTETTYGPYRDQASINEWKVVRQATYRVTGLSAVDIPDYAATILAANSTPVRRVNAVAIPIREAADITKAKALIDLYAFARITNTEKGIDVTHRVTSISHNIVATKAGARWVMGVGFNDPDNVSSPIASAGPSTPPAQGAAGTPGATGATGPAGPPGSNGIAFPIDSPPGSPNAKDDEFDGSSSVTWITTPTAPNAWDINSTRPGFAYLKASGTGGVYVGKYQAVPASYPYTITAKVTSTARANNHRGGGIILAPASPTGASALYYFGSLYSSVAPRYAARILGTFNGGFTSASGAVLSGSWTPIYIRVIVNSATSVTCQASADGVSWFTSEAAFNPGFTPAFMGLASNEESALGGVESWFDWWRIT